MKTILNTSEMAALFRQDPATGNNGGWQHLLVKLQSQCDRATGDIEIMPEDLKRIPQYAFDYSNGGWQNRLVQSFGRVLGDNLDRFICQSNFSGPMACDMNSS
jgi:hypothetical protein